MELDGDGRPARLRGVMVDITDQKRAEDMRAGLEEQLRQAQKMEAVGRLAGGIAHDFNNLLTVISATASCCSSGSASDERSRATRRDPQAGERAAALTRQLLAFSRQQVLRRRSLDLNAIVAGVEKLLAA